MLSTPIFYFSAALLGLAWPVVTQEVTTDAESVLQTGIDAIGGLDGLSTIQTIKYVGGRYVKPQGNNTLTALFADRASILRVRSLYMAVSLNSADQVAVSSGRQNVSFSYEQDHVRQRIDRDLTLGSECYLSHRMEATWNNRVQLF